MAGRPVETTEELAGVRGLSQGTVGRHGRGILAAIRDGLACPQDRWPERPDRVRRHAPPTGLAALLRAAVQVAADREEIAPEVIASTRDIEALVGYATAPSREPDNDGLPLVHGWRGRLIGEQLLAIARGELGIRYDPKRREVVAEPVARG